MFKTALAAAGMSGLLGGNNFTALVPSDEVCGGGRGRSGATETVLRTETAFMQAWRAQPQPSPCSSMSLHGSPLAVIEKILERHASQIVRSLAAAIQARFEASYRQHFLSLQQSLLDTDSKSRVKRGKKTAKAQAGHSAASHLKQAPGEPGAAPSSGDPGVGESMAELWSPVMRQISDDIEAPWTLPQPKGGRAKSDRTAHRRALRRLLHELEHHESHLCSPRATLPFVQGSPN